MTSPETTLYATDLVSVGKFRCPTDHEAFPGGVVHNWLIVFPRTAVRIERDEAPPVVADPTVAVLYDPPSTYRRYAVDPRGDLCDFFAISDTLTDDLSAAVGEDAARVFRRGQGRADPGVYLLQRRIFDLAADAASADPVAIDEGVLAMAEALLAAAAGSAAIAEPPQRAATRARHADLAAFTAELLGASFTERWTLRDIAHEVGSAPHHLSRIFRRVTGTTIHQRLLELRLKRALEVLRDNETDLTRVALELGFSSHSHFSRSFKSVFGISPSRYRAESPQTRTIVQAVAS